MKTLTLLFVSLILSLCTFAQTKGNLSVSVATSSAGGHYAPRNVVAVWIEDDAGNFVKTLLAYAANRKTHLNTWQTSTSDAGSEYNTVDAITGATKTSHSTRTCSWNGSDVNGNIVSDGIYHVWMELTDKNSTGNYTSFSFTKSTTPDIQNPADKPSFSSIELMWEPENSTIFAPIGAEWYYSEHNGGLAPTNSEYLYYECLLDSIIKIENSNINVKKIGRTYYRYSGDTTILTPYYISQIKDTVYLFNPNDNRFDKLYIFNGIKGDTLTLDVPFDSPVATEMQSYRIVIDTITSEIYIGITLKKYQFTGLDGFGVSNSYMDRTGGLDWFTPRGLIFPEAGGPLRCYHDNEIDVKLVDSDCDYRLISNISLIKSNEIMIYPNPTNDIVHIQNPIEIDRILVYSKDGKLINSTSKSEIDLSSFPNGSYILKIESGENYYIKEIIKH